MKAGAKVVYPIAGILNKAPEVRPAVQALFEALGFRVHGCYATEGSPDRDRLFIEVEVVREHRASVEDRAEEARGMLCLVRAAHGKEP